IEIESPISRTRGRPGSSTTGAKAGLCGPKSFTWPKARADESKSSATQRISGFYPKPRSHPWRPDLAADVAEMFDAVEGQIVRVVAARSAAAIVIEGGARKQDEVAAVELPVRILKSVASGVRMLEDHFPHLPLPQVGGGHERERVPDGGRILRAGSG